MEQPQRDANGKVLNDSKCRPKADGSLRDFEKVSLLADPDEYFRREVLPHVPDAFLDLTKTTKGYESNFTRYFYQYQPLRKLWAIRADMLRLETQTEGFFKQVISGKGGPARKQ